MPAVRNRFGTQALHVRSVDVLPGQTPEPAQQSVGRSYGLKKICRQEEGRSEIQGRPKSEIMGKLVLALMALSIAVLIGLSVWVIAL
jgi:hypothetical protein